MAAHPGSCIPGILQARTLEWVAISFSNTCMLSCFSRVQLCVTPWTTAHQAPLSTGFSRQEYWSGLPFPSPCFVFFFYRRLISVSIMSSGFTHVETCMRISSLLLLNNIPLYRDTTICLFTHQLLDTWGASTFGLLRAALQGHPCISLSAHECTPPSSRKGSMLQIWLDWVSRLVILCSDPQGSKNQPQKPPCLLHSPPLVSHPNPPT